jgi:lysophospholipase L1-like esterase
LWFEIHLQPLEPDQVVLQYCLNDNHRFLHRFQPGVGILATEEGRRILLPAEGDPLAWLPRGSYLARRIRLAYNQWKSGEAEFVWDHDIGFAAGWRDDTWQLYETEMLRIKDLVEAGHGELVILVVPLAAQFDPAALARDAVYVFKPQHKLLEISRRHNIRTLDLTPIFASRGGFKFFLPDGIHLNEQGHALAAKELLNFLAE